MILEEARVSIHFNEDGCVIELIDNDSRTTFARVRLNPVQSVQALGRLSHTTCQIEVNGLDKVGKKQIHKPFEFKLPDNFDKYKRDIDFVGELANASCPEGWFVDNYFGSKGSFFEKDGEQWARTTIRSWV